MAAATQSRPIDRILNIVVSAGAVPVLLGALFKLMHWKGANEMLILGLCTEAFIFLCYALLYLLAPPPEPAINTTVAAVDTGNPALKSMDRMLQDADITPTNLKRLSEGFQKLGTTVNDMAHVGDVVRSTSDFGNKAKEATVAMGSMASAFAASANTMQSFNSASEGARNFQDQINVLTKNLGSLNNIYEAELKESNNHLKTLNSFYGKMAEASQTMMSTVDDANRAKDQIGSLATNLSKLNSVYGNMLSAMQGR